MRALSCSLFRFTGLLSLALVAAAAPAGDKACYFRELFGPGALAAL